GATSRTIRKSPSTSRGAFSYPNQLSSTLRRGRASPQPASERRRVRRCRGRVRVPVHPGLERVRALHGNCGSEICTVYRPLRRRVLQTTWNVCLARIGARRNRVGHAGATPLCPRSAAVGEEGQVFLLGNAN